ncbi:MAG: flagellar biosynthesis protein FlhB [Fimbriimonadaceae bacterium]|nr:flagellar biosynthesis protein FlhB [Fimbriimonadaceae bacterium]
MSLFDGKTEAPTPKRRDESRKKGQFAKSRELTSVAVLVAGFSAISAAAPQLYQFLREQMVFYLQIAPAGDRERAMLEAPALLARGSLMVLMPILAAVTTAALVANVGQTGPVLVGESLKFDFTKLNPLKGLQRLISPQSLAELVKSTLKLLLVGWVVYGWLHRNYGGILAMVEMDLLSASTFAGVKIAEMAWKAIEVLAVVAAIDYAWQKYQHEKSLMMTKQEIRDEMRSMEGSPEIRGAIRRRQMEMSRRRMMSNVPQADVVITNPTHYAVALRYDPESMDAPRVVALGQRLVALRIRELAQQHGVPLVENPPLARALFAACDVNSEVPPELYAAVAEVLAYVYRLSGRGRGAG